MGDFPRKLANVNYVEDLGTPDHLACVMWLTAAFGVKDCLIQTNVFPIFNGNHGSLRFLEVTVN
jgi:hypothetical protein